MNSTPDQNGSQIPDPWSPRFGIGGMLLVMIVFSMMAAAGYYLVQSVRYGGRFHLGFIFVTLTAPILATIVLSFAFQWLTRRERRRRRREKRDDWA
ncbi:MAG: hypothetical protein R3C99_10155 [Pirellulaceae bacterium]|nr:hypothetical protein [Planctomycetales bacterium]MCA9203491.1 hypothetical protein [Planctomycetales bacterium]MCA9223751.1 hypothetical protein [Planctomycetales bacterium]